MASEDPIFESEVERLRAAGVAGASGRLRDLLDYLAERGPEGEPATQGDIARDVFGQDRADADDATVRVYIHRLRKKMEDHYAASGSGGARLEIPAGTYALRLAVEEGMEEEAEAVANPPWRRRAGIVLALVVLPLSAFWLGLVLEGRRGAVNAIWEPFLDSERPVLLVLGDYYIFGEIDPVRPDEGRLIRDFRINSPEDLLALQEAEPDRYQFAEDFGLNYLPFSAAYGVTEIAPLLAREDEEIRVIASSELEPDMLGRYDVVYIGLLSGLGLLENSVFAGSSLEVGESYDELVDRERGEAFVSDEARSVASPAFYRDYGYVARFRGPGGGLVAIMAGSRDTDLRGISPLLTGDLPPDIAAAAREDSFEALFQITGQQGADLSERLLFARERE
jgi:hypothetical protein